MKLKTKPSSAWHINVRPCHYCGKSVYFDMSIYGKWILIEYVTQNRHHCIGKQ